MLSKKAPSPKTVEKKTAGAAAGAVKSANKKSAIPASAVGVVKDASAALTPTNNGSISHSPAAVTSNITLLSTSPVKKHVQTLPPSKAETGVRGASAPDDAQTGPASDAAATTAARATNASNLPADALHITASNVPLLTFYRDPAGRRREKNVRTAATVGAAEAEVCTYSGKLQAGDVADKQTRNKPFLSPRLRPKKTHTGLEERLRETGNDYEVYIHWDSYAGHHVHVLPRQPDEMHADDLLSVTEKPLSFEQRKERSANFQRVPPCGFDHSSNGTVGGADATLAIEAPAEKKKEKGLRRHSRHCIPMYRFQPSICANSRRLVDKFREARIQQLWAKLDTKNKGVIDMYSLLFEQKQKSARQAKAPFSDAFLSYSGGLNGAPVSQQGSETVGVKESTTATAASAVEKEHLSWDEERFVQEALIPLFLTAAVSSPSQTASAAARAATGAKQQLAEKERWATDKNVALLLHVEDDSSKGSSNAKAALATTAQDASGTWKNVSRETTQLPKLLVPKDLFVKTALHALAYDRGEAGVAAAAAVAAYRAALMRGCYRSMQQRRRSVFGGVGLDEDQQLQQGEKTPARAAPFFDEKKSLYYAPYVLNYSRRQRAAREEEEEQRQTVAEIERRQQRQWITRTDEGGNRGRVKDTRLKLSTAADWGSAVSGGERKKSVWPRADIAAESDAELFPAVGLRRVQTRVDEQIAHYMRKKRQLHHIKLALEDMQQRQMCTFHPEINRTPRYIRKLRAARATEQRLQQQRHASRSCRQQQESVFPDPLATLEMYCKYYSEDKRFEKLCEDVRECCFQPNVEKFILREQKLQERLLKKEQELQQQGQDEGLKKLRESVAVQWRDEPLQGPQQQQGAGERGREGRGRQQLAHDEKNSRRGQLQTLQKELRSGTCTRTATDKREPVLDAVLEKPVAAVNVDAAAATDGAAALAGSTGGTSALDADALFGLLEKPLFFDTVFQSDIRSWLKAEGRKYLKKKKRERSRRSSTCCSSVREDDSDFSEEEEEEQQVHSKQQQQSWKPWVREKRAPQYRGPREEAAVREALLSAAFCNEDASSFGGAEPTKPAPATAAALVDISRGLSIAAAAANTKRHKKKQQQQQERRAQHTTPYNRWVEGLRGGYLKMDMNFSRENEDNQKKTQRYCMRDWSRYIRLQQRGVVPRVIPDTDIADALYEAERPSTEKPEPTIWIHRRKRLAPENRGPSAETFTEANLFHTYDTSISSSDNIQYQRANNLAASGLRAGRGSDDEGEVTVFTVPTPVKPEKIREKYRVYIQLRNAIESGEMPVPPRVFALKADALSALENEVREEVPNLLLGIGDQQD